MEIVSRRWGSARIIQAPRKGALVAGLDGLLQNVAINTVVVYPPCSFGIPRLLGGTPEVTANST